MKRFMSIVLVVCIMLAVCGCAKTSVSENAKVTLTFIHGEQNIIVALPDAEAAKVIEIIDGNSYDPVSAGVSSCGFDENISLKVGGRTFAIACDTCNTIQDLGNFRYFSVSQEEIDYIHSLFKKYGGHFPCV